MSQRDENFNEFFSNFKSKNEQGWSNIIDLTQEEQEDKFLETTPEMRKNQMVMMEEFKRRKSLKDYHGLMNENQRKTATNQKMPEVSPLDGKSEANAYHGSGVERFFEPKRDEIFNPREFTMVFLASDSVTNVTSLNRTNQRRVLIFLGNGRGLVSYGKGKAQEYEQAFENAFKDARKNMLMLDIEEVFTSPRLLEGRHNDFKIKIFP